jgi:hypothetical protein
MNRLQPKRYAEPIWLSALTGALFIITALELLALVYLSGAGA